MPLEELAKVLQIEEIAPELPKEEEPPPEFIFSTEEMPTEELADKPQLRFVEDVFADRATKPDAKAARKRKKKGIRGEGPEKKESGIKSKRGPRPLDLSLEDEDYEEY